MDKTTLQILTEARRLIEKPEHWTQGEDARDADGEPELPDSERATCFCMGGAIARVAYGESKMKAYDALYAVIGGELGVVNFNDAPGRAHADVLAMFDRAIEAQRTSVTSGNSTD